MPQALQQAVVVAARGVLPTGYKSAPFSFKNQISHGAESGGDLSALNQREPAPADKPLRVQRAEALGRATTRGSASPAPIQSFLPGLFWFFFVSWNKTKSLKGKVLQWVRRTLEPILNNPVVTPGGGQPPQSGRRRQARKHQQPLGRRES